MNIDKLLEATTPADDFFSNHELAKAYVERRQEDATKFTSELKWVTHPEGHSIIADVYGVKLIHFFAERDGYTHWGELHKEMKEFPGNWDTDRFDSFECMVAHMLAKFW